MTKMAPPITAAPILECRNLSISYATRSGDVQAVRDFNLRLMPGEAHGIVGESGCGKSTVALGIMNYLGHNGAITGGEILFEGRNLATLSPQELRAIRGARIAMVYQEPMASLNPSMTIGRQLAEVPICHESVSLKGALERAEAMLASVRLPDPKRIMTAYPHQISGGQQQRIVIAMALLSNPRLLLLDEPTTALDVTVEAGIVELIREISANFGTSMLYISHNLGLIRATCDRMTVMYAGEAVEVGDVDTVFRRMRHPYTRGLFSSIPMLDADKNARPLIAIPGHLPLPYDQLPGCSFAPRCNHAVAGLCDQAPLLMQAVDAASVVRETDHTTRCVRFSAIDWNVAAVSRAPRPAIQPGDTVLSVEHLTKHYVIEQPGLLMFGGAQRTIKANEDISFVAREAETVAIVGESGCGKSTFAKVLMGLEQASAGSIKLGTLELGNLAVQKRDAGTIGRLQMIFQNPFDTLNPSYSVGAQIARVVAKFGGEKDKDKVRARVFDLLDMVKLPRAFAERLPRQLSGGQKQRIGIARAFAGNPNVIVADEPVSALDVSVQAAVTDLLMDIQRDHRTTMLFISHDLPVVRYLADRVVVMYLGRIMEQGTTDQVFAPPYHPYTEALLAAVPIADPDTIKRKVVLTGELPSAANPPKGCPFSARCAYAIQDLCTVTLPPLRLFAGGHAIACHLDTVQLLAMAPVFSQRGEALTDVALPIEAANENADHAVTLAVTEPQAAGARTVPRKPIVLDAAMSAVLREPAVVVALQPAPVERAAAGSVERPAIRRTGAAGRPRATLAMTVPALAVAAPRPQSSSLIADAAAAAQAAAAAALLRSQR
jgi:peptide/nickel transport system ATP-binding protein